MPVDVFSLSAKVFGSQWATHRFETDHGPGIVSLGDTASFDYRHTGSSARLELKSSRPSAKGVYTFQNINPKLFDVGIFLAYNAGTEPFYWIIPSMSLTPFLSIQRRDSEIFQMRVSQKSFDRFSEFLVPKNELKQHLEAACRLVMKKSQRVFLDSAFAKDPGWIAVANKLNSVLKKEFDPKLIIRILPAPHDDNGLVPYPIFVEAEFRFDYYANLNLSLYGSTIHHTVSMIVDFLYNTKESDFI